MDLDEVLDGRAGLAGVQWLLSGRTARQAMRRSLESLLAGATLGPCRLKRAKFKPGRSLTAYYEARLSPSGFTANGRTGGAGIRSHETRLIEVSWKPGRSATNPEIPGIEFSNLQEEASQRGLMAPFRQLLCEVPEWGMRIQVFPLDVHFPQLIRLADPKYVGEMLSASEAGNGKTQEISVTPVRYRPRQRHVLRYDCLTGGAPDGTVYAKIYSDQSKGLKSFQAATWASDWFAQHVNGVVGSRPMAYLAGDGVILYPKVQGIPFSRLLKRGIASTGIALSLAGNALRSIHSAPAGQADQLVPRLLLDEIKTIDRASDHLRALLPEARLRIEAILDGAIQLHDRLPQEPPAFAHSDFKSDHLLVTPKGITIIDFDTSSIADPALDVGKFLADLDWWFTWYDQPGLAEAQRRLLESYAQEEVPEARLARARIYEALVLIRIAVRRVPIFSKNWAELTTRLILKAEDQWKAILH